MVYPIIDVIIGIGVMILGWIAKKLDIINDVSHKILWEIERMNNKRNDRK